MRVECERLATLSSRGPASTASRGLVLPANDHYLWQLDSQCSFDRSTQVAGAPAATRDDNKRELGVQT
jgi:hypothetical protein